ncbi:MAG: CBS domain-containing protein [Desulfomonile tiedjei]|uniref:CBS domain-containing protein n=1 Tax=Desulfomonile tiedjei TaxID=2358 RepID=A0A9D6Z2A5_9BACT|nr:CBS domain-containing protein [Desulfomonile tiedjei]
MDEATQKSVLSDATVKEAMRVQVLSLSAASPINHGIRQLIKYKSNAFLVNGEGGAPVGVVSKTDIIGAYYAGLPIESPLGDIMVSPPMFCSPGDSLESALDTMRSQRIYRLYVRNEASNEVVGALAYPDIVGLLYGYCRSCDRSVMNRKKNRAEDPDEMRIRVKDVMTESVVWSHDDDNLSQIMEELSEHRCGAVLIRNRSRRPISVISKTDLILAYARGIQSEAPARNVLASSRVISCQDSTFLEDAIRKMILSDLQRLFAWSEIPENIVGVISLSDAARVRSGSCHACISSRIRVE